MLNCISNIIVGQGLQSV